MELQESECFIETEENAASISVEELLINCVMARPPLWDSRLPLKERSKNIRDRLWTEVFEEFGSNPDFSIVYLLKKWRNLRDSYVRLRGEMHGPSGSAAPKKARWEYYEQMSFLNDTIGYRATVSNVDTPTSSPVPSCTSRAASPQLTSPQLKSTQPRKVESAILEALDKINAPVLEVPGTPSINPICMRISEILGELPARARTLLEIKLLQVAYDGAKDYMK